ncbi:MAG: dephospho-CoA kinase [Acidaminococcales bacterium]|nr:dephospho-CoA kinase [Acidaminococcales bacterium]
MVGLTGGIASGKSTVSAILKKLKAPLFDADREAHRLIAKGGAAFAPIKEEFAGRLGLDIMAADGEIDRKKLGAAVFGEPKLLARLEGHLHCLVERNLRKFAEKAEKRGFAAMVADIPLLIEKSWQNKVDKIWLVYLPENLQLERLCRRDRLSAENARRRMGAQLPLAAKLPYADLVIDNSGDITQIREKVEKAWKNLLL